MSGDRSVKSETVNLKVSQGFEDAQKDKIKILVRGYYDTQKLRIATGNRIVASIRPDFAGEHINSASAGEEVRKDKETQDKELRSMLSVLVNEYEKITDCFVREFNSKGHIKKSIDRLGDSVSYVKSEMDYRLVKTYIDLCNTEQDTLKLVSNEVVKHPMWEAFFKSAGGCGSLMAAVCISSLDVHKARFASSFWKYAGLDVVNEPADEKDSAEVQACGYKGVGRSRKSDHLVQREYTDKDGNSGIKKGLSYNPELKTKLCGVLGTCFLRASNSTYKDAYYNYRARLDHNHRYDNHTNLHKHNMAIRYSVKLFLADLWKVWRKYEGYDIGVPYAEAYLDRKPHHYNAADRTTSLFS